MDTSDSAAIAPAVEVKEVQSPNAHIKDDKDRILRRGDLARIIGRKKRLKDHFEGALAKVSRNIPIDDSVSTDSAAANGHDFHYDVDLVLGGKLTNLDRADLEYTTAEAEGMIGDTRARRKRKTEPKEPQETSKPPSSSDKPKTQKKTSGKQAKGAGKKRKASDTGKGAGSKKSKAAAAVDPSSTTTPANAADVYERHRREFEKFLTRLEKVDEYGHFYGPVPPEFDETYKSKVVEFEETLSETKEAVDETKSTEVHENQQQSAETAAPKKPQNEEEIIFPDSPPYNFDIIRKRMEKGRYVLDLDLQERNERYELMLPYYQSIGAKISKPKKKKRPSTQTLHPIAVNWDLCVDDISKMCEAALARNPGENTPKERGTLGFSVVKIKEAVEQAYEKTAKRQITELSVANDRHRFTLAMEAQQNASAAMQGKWRKHAYPERKYERLKTDAVCSGLSDLDERIALYELKTSLPDSFVGLSYTYDDTGQSEGWMTTLMNDAADNEQKKTASALASDDGVIKAQVAASMQSLLIAVQDRVMTQSCVLEQKELKSANWIAANNESDTMDIDETTESEIMEQEVWGMDCYTRKNISICLGTDLDEDTILVFIEKWLLPAINSCPKDIAHNISNAAKLLEGLPFDPESSILPRGGSTMEEWRTSLLGKALLTKIESSSPPWLKAAATLLRRAHASLGPDFFRLHPKGHGSIVLCPKIEPNRLVTFYRGEVYPSWRWGEKMDAIEITQERKGLKPVLPDFFNMALERPQTDPRGYGLLFVDASRKSGYGSMLSHSCEPTCEVRVAAVNGKLTLAMTTLREMHMGDELTFDYNAVTESLNEYQSAVCLCGHGRCRGSFLHFATADCYQEVLNRNAPIAVRLANLIKGCMKKVMSEDDEKLLRSHGFQTAAFGAVSVNRRRISNDEGDVMLDSMDFVPIWLRTFVADTLRYIEYERRALPISLLTASSSKKAGDKDSSGTSRRESDKIAERKEAIPTKPDISPEDEKPIKGAKPEPSFFCFSRTKRDELERTLKKKAAYKDLKGLDLRRETSKLASALWKEMDDAEKQSWKDKAMAEWENNGGKEKGRLEEERQKRVAKAKKAHKAAVNKAKAAAAKKKKGGKSAKEDVKPAKEEEQKSEATPKLSFQAADAEGISAMEQRIQQLTQTLSRVGRVLDRHRENVLSSLDSSVISESALQDPSNAPKYLRELSHTPMGIMPDEHIIAWMWNHDHGVVKSLIRLVSNEVCVSPEMKLAIEATCNKYSSLEKFGTPWCSAVPPEDFPMTPQAGKEQLMTALLDLRVDLINGMKDMAKAIKDHRANLRKEKASHSETQGIIRGIMNEMIKEVEKRCSGGIAQPNIEDEAKLDELEVSDDNADTDDSAGLPVWLQNYNKRFKLQKAADLLLMYAKTSTYFALKPYKPLKSTPIEVYARELGNEVPKESVDENLRKEPEIDETASTEKKEDELTFQEASLLTNPRTSHNLLLCDHKNDETDGSEKATKKHKQSRLCEAEDIITEVAVEYQGDYVLSQLLQWSNGGIGQKPGLPDMLGCILLPSLDGTFSIDTTRGSSSRIESATGYQKSTRLRLAEWLKDPVQRGGPWPDEVRRAFITKELEANLASPHSFSPFGSPVLDFFVTGDDSNIMSILDVIGAKSKGDEEADDFLTSVDHGRPAQAVSNWVQCENQDCLKWRRLPWHVDVDTLGEKFFCKDNIWNPTQASCDAPAEEWDESQDAQVAADGSVPIVDPMNTETVIEESKNTFKVSDFVVGVQFDVLREFNNKWYEATIVTVDFSGPCPRAKFHYKGIATKSDEWVNIDSPRIAPLHNITKPRPTKKNKQKGSKSGKVSQTKHGNSSIASEDHGETAGPSETSSLAESSKGSANQYAENDSIDTDDDQQLVVSKTVDRWLKRSKVPKKKKKAEALVDENPPSKSPPAKENTSSNRDETLHMSTNTNGELVVGGRIPKKASPPKKERTQVVNEIGSTSGCSAPNRIPRKSTSSQAKTSQPSLLNQKANEPTSAVIPKKKPVHVVSEKSQPLIQADPPPSRPLNSAADYSSMAQRNFTHGTSQQASIDRNGSQDAISSQREHSAKDRIRKLEERLSAQRRDRQIHSGYGDRDARQSPRRRRSEGYDGYDDRHYRSYDQPDRDGRYHDERYERSHRSPERSRDRFYRSPHRNDYSSRSMQRQDGYSEYDDSYNMAYRGNNYNDSYSSYDGDRANYDGRNQHRPRDYDGFHGRSHNRHSDYQHSSGRYQESSRHRSRSRERHDYTSSSDIRRRRGSSDVEPSVA